MRDAAVERRRTGAEPSFRALYDAYFAFVWRCARRFGVPEDAVADVVHDTFAAAHARVASRESTEGLRSLLYGLVRRKVAAYRRAERVRQARTSMPFLIEDTVGAMAPAPGDLGRLSDEVQATWRILLQLEPCDRELLILADLDRASLPDVAETLGIEAYAVHPRLWAARRAFTKVAANGPPRQTRNAHTRTAKSAARREAGRIGEWLDEGALLLRFGPGMFSPNSDDQDRVLACLLRTLGPAVTGPMPSPRTRATESAARLRACAWAIGGLSVLVVMAFAPWLHPRALKGEPSALETPEGVVDAASTARPLLEPGPREPTAFVRDESVRTRASRKGGRSDRDSLPQEADLLANAKRQLIDGLPGEALRSLAEEARRFPRGDLSEERLATRIQALCALGRGAEARSELKRLGRVHPRSMHVEQARQACAAPPGVASEWEN